MDVLVVVLSVVLIAVCWLSAVADFRRAPQIVATMERLGVPLRLIPVLGIAKAAGGLGLLLGQWNDALLTFSAICLAAYFLSATVVHLRAKDPASGTAPAAVLMILGIVLVAISI